jgi:23S rRNA pseudouridine1911/1915/1917 synthase
MNQDLQSAVSLAVLLEDLAFRVIHKPSRLSVLKDNTGRSSVWDLYPVQFGEPPLLVHRIDKGTSGLLIVARTRQARSALSRLFNQGKVRKAYLALVQGVPDPKKGMIDKPLEKGRKGRFRVAEGGRGLPSRTQYEVLATDGQQSLVLCRPLTGRTHQIRLHLWSLGCPLVKDPLYGPERSKPSQNPELTLHAWRLEFPHPGTGEGVRVEAPPPEWAQTIPWEAPSW